MEVQIGTRMWDELNKTGLTVVRIWNKGTKFVSYEVRDDDPKVGNMYMTANDLSHESIKIL